MKIINIISTILNLLNLVISEESECVVKQYDEVEAALQTCNEIILDSITVPAGMQLKLNIQNGSTVVFRGNITFEKGEWEGPLIFITGSDFVLRGEEGSMLEGNGPLYWDGMGVWGSTKKPKFLKMNAANALMENIKLHNCPVACVMIRGTENVTIRNWFLDVLEGDKGVAPDNQFGHNTDGFTIANTNNLILEDTTVYNQDDCVVISSGENITVRNVFCHGSHGLSINGLGEVLKHVLITNSTITNAENGIHVKAHLGSPPGLVQNITYKDVTILDSKNYGINIQQNYQSLPEGEPMNEPPDNSVQIRNLNFINIVGNVKTDAIPVYILCAEEGCFDWKWQDVQIYGMTQNNCTGYVPEGYSDCGQ